MFTPVVLNTEGGALGAEQPKEVLERDSAYKPTTPESEPVAMEDVGPPGTLSVSATGEARKKWSSAWGDFTLTEELHRDRPVYRNSDVRYNVNLYSLESGAWGLSWTIGDSQPVIRSTTPAPSPALCQNWEYREYRGSEYKPGDISVVDISDPGESLEFFNFIICI